MSQKKMKALTSVFLLDHVHYRGKLSQQDLTRLIDVLLKHIPTTYAINRNTWSDKLRDALQATHESAQDAKSSIDSLKDYLLLELDSTADAAKETWWDSFVTTLDHLSYMHFQSSAIITDQVYLEQNECPGEVDVALFAAERIIASKDASNKMRLFKLLFGRFVAEYSMTDRITRYHMMLMALYITINTTRSDFREAAEFQLPTEDIFLKIFECMWKHGVVNSIVLSKLHKLASCELVPNFLSATRQVINNSSANSVPLDSRLARDYSSTGIRNIFDHILEDGTMPIHEFMDKLYVFMRNPVRVTPSAPVVSA